MSFGLSKSVKEEVIAESKPCTITTVDNPYDPFDDFVSWHLFDIEKGYNSLSKLARLAEDLKDDQSDQEQQQIIENAVDLLVSIDPLDIYKKVYMPA